MRRKGAGAVAAAAVTAVSAAAVTVVVVVVAVLDLAQTSHAVWVVVGRLQTIEAVE